jgi:MFS family permease
LTGIGFGGAYMPGLKALTDRVPQDHDDFGSSRSKIIVIDSKKLERDAGGKPVPTFPHPAPGESSRAVTLYTSAYSFGVGLSFLVAYLAAEQWGWRAAFFVTGIPPLLMVTTALLLSPHRPAESASARMEIRPVLRNRSALGYILGYGFHCFELYGVRTWIVAFWTFVVANNAGSGLLSPVAVSVAITVLAAPASILGNEAAIRFGRHRALTAVMSLSAIVTAAVGLCAGASPYILLPLVILQAITVNADSGALTSGMTAAAVPANRGATMALHSTVGFGLAAAGGWATGAAIDAGGGQGATLGWTLAFLVMALAIACGPLALWCRGGRHQISHHVPTGVSSVKGRVDGMGQSSQKQKTPACPASIVRVSPFAFPGVVVGKVTGGKQWQTASTRSSNSSAPAKNLGKRPRRRQSSAPAKACANFALPKWCNSTCRSARTARSKVIAPR